MKKYTINLNKILPSFSLLACLLLVSLFSSAQDNDFDLKIRLGYSSNWLLGEARSGIRSLHQDIENDQSRGFSFRSQLYPHQSPNASIVLRYWLSDKIAIETGLQYGQQGYNARIKGLYKDELYQFDQKYTYKEKFRLNYFAFPINLEFQAKEKLGFTLGFLIGIGQQQASEMIVMIKEKSIINGKVSDEFSEGKTKESIRLPKASKNPFLGANIGISYRISPKVSVKTGFQGSINYAKLDYGMLSNVSFGVSLDYTLVGFDKASLF